MKARTHELRTAVRVIAVMCWIGAAVNTWAGGGREQGPRNNPNLTFVPTQGFGNHTYAIHQTLVMGGTLVEATSQNGSWSHVALYDEARERFDPLAAENASALRSLLTASGASWGHQLGPSEATGIVSGWEQLVPYGRIDATDGRRLRGRMAQFLVADYGPQSKYRAVLWAPGGSGYAQIEVEASGEFFPGEADLFPGTGNLPHAVRAVLFLYGCFPATGSNAEDNKTAFREAAFAALDDLMRPNGLTGADGDLWRRYADRGGLEQQKSLFYTTFQQDVKVSREVAAGGLVDAPILAWPEGSFEAVYGGGRPGYTTAWLSYNYRHGRPLLAALIDEAFRGTGERAGVLPGYEYDWRQYEMLDQGKTAAAAEEGKAFAKAALRYLTWSTDYALPAGFPDFSPQPITEEGDLETIRTWVVDRTGTETDGLPAAPKAVPTNTPLPAARYAPVAGTDAGDAAALSAVRGLLSTPFSCVGNPVAWVPGGVDTPRTFAYKLFESSRAARWRERAQGGTADEPQVVSDYFLGREMFAIAVGSGNQGSADDPHRYDSPEDIVKPYRAGWEPNVGVEQEISVDKSAGVDSAGLLSGVLVMSGLYDRVLSLVNEAPAAALEEYASMRKPSGGGTISVPGLDSRTGLPNFAARKIDGNGVASGAYRFTRGDIERMTVLVPALELVQEGDLVVGPGEGDQYELGIVVGKTAAIATRQYASMPVPASGQTLSIPGLQGETGLPNFAVLSVHANGVASGGYRFSRADIERMTVLVPALAQVHEGDLVLGPGSGTGYCPSAGFDMAAYPRRFPQRKQWIVVAVVIERRDFAVMTEDESGSVGGGNYRFSRADLERMTVLVPDLGLVQAGDLVLGPGQADRYELGIVVAKDNGLVARPQSGAGYDPREARKKIVVLSVNRRVGHVFVSRWEAGPFTDDPDAFQLRRLVRRMDQGPLAQYPAGEYDPLTADGNAMVMDVMYAQSTFVKATAGEPRAEGHWIPNTGEVLGIDEIRIRRAGEPILSEADPEVQVLGLVDAAASGHEVPVDGSNIWWNQGGGFRLVAILPDKTQMLAEYAHQAGLEGYVLSGTDGGLLPDGRAGSAGGLYLRGGKVTYEGAGGKTTAFGLVALDGARPGDDVLLRFRVHEAGRSTATEVVASSWDFAAVYDKKLLWRANLYVDEGGEADWNNRNPWVGAENEWYVAASDGAYRDGGQIPIRDSTRWTDGTVAEDSVGYAWGGMNSVAEYNRRMGVQAALIADGRTSGEGTLYLGDSYAQMQWDGGSTAPRDNDAAEHDWYNYVFPGRRDGSYLGVHYYDYSYEEDNFPEMPQGFRAQHAYRVNRRDREVFVPGLSTFMHFGPASPYRFPLPNSTSLYESNQVNVTPGADCAGLVDAAAGYAGNIYVIDHREKHNATALSQNAWLIAPGAETDAEAEIPTTLDRVVPGDILVLPGSHVVIVLDVQRPLAGAVKRDNVRFIHEGSGPRGEYQALTDNVWNGETGLRADRYFRFQAARLKTVE